MRRNARINAILAALVAALAVLAWWQVRSEIGQREPALSTLDPSTVGRIHVRCTQCVAREFVRSDGDWRMRAPYPLDADDALVGRLLAIAGSPVRARHAIADFDPAKIGLAPPLMTLELGALIFEIGMADALRGDRYVRVGDVIAMVPDRFSPFLMATPESELDRHLLPRGTSIVALRIDGVDAPQRIDAWRSAVASKIEAVAADAADAPRPGTAVHVELALGSGETMIWNVWRVADAWRARRDSPALDYALDASAIDALIGSASTR